MLFSFPDAESFALCKDVFRNYSFLDNVSRTYILTYVAVFTDIRIDDCVSAISIDSQVRAVQPAVFTEETAGTADLSLGSAVVFR